MGMIKDDTVRNATAYFWGERTSTIDWCEENYAVSNYIAEFWNTLTNAAMILLAALGIYSSIRYRHGKRVTAMYVGMLVVGCGSACFHATLKYTTQLLDELPMLYLCAIALYSFIEIDKKVQFGVWLPTSLAAFQLTITLTYLFWVQNPIFHQIAFAATAIGAAVVGCNRLYTTNMSSGTRRALFRLHLLGHLGMWGGFLAWNIDNVFCHNLRSYRGYVGTPLDALLQLHGWWHILTAYGSAFLLLWAHLLRLARLGHDNLYSVQYFMGVFPYVGMKQPKKID